MITNRGSESAAAAFRNGRWQVCVDNSGPKGQRSVRDIRTERWVLSALRCGLMFGSRVGVVYRHVRLVQILSAGLSLRVLHLACRGYRLEDLFHRFAKLSHPPGGFWLLGYCARHSHSS